MYSPMSEGLFHRAMSLSGTALGSWGVTGHGLEKAQRLAKYVDCDTTDVKDMINCLKSIPGPRLVSEMLKFMVRWSYCSYNNSKLSTNVLSCGKTTFFLAEKIVR